jgi:hypothetical protein
VWKALQRPEAWGAIGGVRKVDNATFNDEGELTGYRFLVDAGGSGHVGRARRSAVLEGRRITMEIDSDLLAGQIAIALEPDGDHTGVTVEMTMLPKGLMSMLLLPMIVGAVGAGFEETVEHFVDGLAG